MLLALRRVTSCVSFTACGATLPSPPPSPKVLLLFMLQLLPLRPWAPQMALLMLSGVAGGARGVAAAMIRWPVLSMMLECPEGVEAPEAFEGDAG